MINADAQDIVPSRFLVCLSHLIDMDDNKSTTHIKVRQILHILLLVHSFPYTRYHPSRLCP